MDTASVVAVGRPAIRRRALARYLHGNLKGGEYAWAVAFLVPYIAVDNSVSWRCGGANAPTNSLMTGASFTDGGTLAGSTMVKYLPAACRP